MLCPAELQPQANQSLNDNFHGTEGNHLMDVPRGEQKLLGVPYTIGEKCVHVRGNGGAKEQPEAIAGFKVDQAGVKLHFLHATGYGEAPPVEDGIEIGTYVVHYGDKTMERIPIIYGESLRDWWDWPDRPNAKAAKVAWTGTNPAAAGNERKVRLFAFTWDNPHPDIKIATVDMVSKTTECDPFLVALTVEQK